jgi:hypothetical protein
MQFGVKGLPSADRMPLSYPILPLRPLNTLVLPLPGGTSNLARLFLENQWTPNMVSPNMTTVPEPETVILLRFGFFYQIVSNILFQNYDDVQEDELEEEDDDDVEEAPGGASSDDEMEDEAA